MLTLSPARVRALLAAASRTRILVIGDLMLDQFIWGQVNRISPEAPVPVVEYGHESSMPGGAANVARNLTALGAPTQLLGSVGRDESGTSLIRLLQAQGVDCAGLLRLADRPTSIKTRIIAHQQQVVRLDRETRGDFDPPTTAALLARLDARLESADAVIIGDYGKGVVTQALLDGLKPRCRDRGLWLSLDPKPTHRLQLNGLSLITPNRKEAFALAGRVDSERGERGGDPRTDTVLLGVVDQLLREFAPAVLLVTLGEHGMLLCQKHQCPVHIPTVAQEVFDVSGAGDTVIASFTLAIAAGASPLEAAIFANHAAGIVVGKVGTATASAAELLASFAVRSAPTAAPRARRPRARPRS